ncbi:MAG TPA: hypothetical protein VM661_08415 [Candidatus Sulfotelmatobacter sp.]|jgi:hypothetical protein|nr:hypothetical protein [Candidatus Sulfotelmatobacter sp.]
MHTIWILSLEPIETRYTAQWFAGVPQQVAAYAEVQGVTAQVHMDPADFGQEAIDSGALNIVNLPGDGGTQRTSAGAFLNFATTNLWKNQQVNRFIGMIEAGLVRNGDKVLVTDAWHPGILQLAYMRDLLDVSFDISAIWHAGSYDPWDFLGRGIPDKRWSYATERALFWGIDRNFFTTSFHWGLFCRSLKIDDGELGQRTAYSGYPNEYLWDELPPHRVPPDERPNLILFPHRLAPEKQLDIFKDLAATLPQYEWVVCQEQNLTKLQYHALLGRAKMSFSAALQETLGIAQAEATIAGAMPLSPRRLAYNEQYSAPFLYPSDWTASWEAYKASKDFLVAYIRTLMHDYATPKMQVEIARQEQALKVRYLTATPLYRHLVGA